MSDFLRHPSDVVRAFRTGILFIGDQMTQFKFSHASNTDIRRVELLTNVFVQNKMLVIKTTSALPFEVNSTIVIGERKYSINTMYEEDLATDKSEYGFTTGTPTKYLFLERYGD